MSFGFELINNAGAVMVDDVLPQIHLIESGSAAGYAWDVSSGATARTVTFSRTITNPMLFVRSATGNFFTVMAVYGTGFRYMSESALDWYVYEGAIGAHTPSGYGLVVYNPSGELIFDAEKSFPIILQKSVAITSGDTINAANLLLRTVTFAGTAYDGGLPFLSASTCGTTYFIFSNTGGGLIISGVCYKFVSATTVEVWSKPTLSYGSNPYANASGGVTGQKPREMTFLK